MNTYQEKYVSNFMVDKPEQIRAKTQRLTQYMVQTFIESNFAEINGLLQGTKVMDYTIQGYLQDVKLDIEEKQMLVEAGYNSALLDVMRLYIEKLYAKEEIHKIKTSYRDRVLHILDKRGSLLHKDLASELMVSASGLTAIIRQMNATSVKLIHVEEFSKFKVYSLTPIARRYIKNCMQDCPDDRGTGKPNIHEKSELMKVGTADHRFDGQALSSVQMVPFYYSKHDKQKEIYQICEQDIHQNRQNTPKFSSFCYIYELKHA